MPKRSNFSNKKKVCTRCKESKDADEFYIHKSKYKTSVYEYLTAQCKECVREMNKGYLENNPHKRVLYNERLKEKRLLIRKRIRQADKNGSRQTN